MTNNTKNKVSELIDFISQVPTAYHTVEKIGKMLEEAGFSELHEYEKWSLEEGHGYFVTRGGSSLIAFRLPDKKKGASFMIAASHSDSPTFALKEKCECESAGYVRLDTEKYGGMIISTWFDRPLSVAGRVVTEKDGRIDVKTVKVDRPLVIIPSVAIHFNRDVNNGYKYNPACDSFPLFSAAGKQDAVKLDDVIRESAEIDKDTEIIGKDLVLYDRTPGCIFGAGNEFFACPRIDNIECAYTTLRGFISACAKSPEAIPVYAVFDNEETGSETKQGAASGFLFDVLTNICEYDGCKLSERLPASFMLSADNAHSVHPNHPELSDPLNRPVMNGGIVIKHNASRKYATDAISSAIFSKICERAGVKVQHFFNRSDMPGGSTLGSISDTKVSLNTCDIGLAQLAMHSSYETAGCDDVEAMEKAAHSFFTSVIECNGGSYTLK